MQLQPPPLPALLPPGAAEVRADALPPPAHSPRGRQPLRDTRCHSTRRVLPRGSHSPRDTPALPQPRRPPALIPAMPQPNAVVAVVAPAGCGAWPRALGSEHSQRLLGGTPPRDPQQPPRQMRGSLPTLCQWLSRGLGRAGGAGQDAQTPLLTPGVNYRPTVLPARGSFALSSCPAKGGGTRCSSMQWQDDPPARPGPPTPCYLPGAAGGLC